MKGVTPLRRFAILRVTALLVIVMAGLASYLVWSPLPAKAATSDTVLFIHGFNGPTNNGNFDTVPGGCGGTWGTAESYFSSSPHNWTGSLLTVGFYRGDSDSTKGNYCNIQFDRQAPNSQHQSNCDNYPSSHPLTAADEGTNNQDLGNISCQVAWYIYNTYTTAGQNVHVVAHSMGGLIIRYALDRVYAGDPAFPPYLDVPTVITMSSPHGGIPNPGGANALCGGCRMGSNMQQGTNGPDYFINTLLNESVAPMGSPGEPTEWTLMAGKCESWAEGVKDDAALNFPNGRSGYPVVHKIDYMTVPNQANGCDFGNGFRPSYLHEDYRYDTSDSQNVIALGCDNCDGYPLPALNGSIFHSLHVTFQNTAISILPAPSYPVLNQTWGANFLNDWWQTGGAHGALGDPTNGLYSLVVGGQVGWAQNFWTGGTYWWPATGDHVVYGALYTDYNDFNGPAGGLGFPTTDVQGIASGSVSYFYGNLCGGRGPNNSGSAIYYTSSTGAHLVGGCIYNRYWHDLGGPGGNANFNVGFPSSDVLAISGGYVSYFFGNLCGARGPYSSGSAVYSGSRGTFIVGGCIYNKYWNMGATSSVLGYPTSDVQAISGGYVGYFQGGGCGSSQASAIYYSSATSTHEVQGCIYLEYQHIGATNALGFPMSDEQNVYNSSGGVIGRENIFNGAGCGGTGSVIIWSSSTNAHEVQGCIYNAYANLGGAASKLGLPVSDEYSNGSGLRESDFQGGYIIWDGQAHVYYYNCLHCS